MATYQQNQDWPEAVTKLKALPGEINNKLEGFKLTEVKIFKTNPHVTKLNFSIYLNPETLHNNKIVNKELIETLKLNSRQLERVYWSAYLTMTNDTYQYRFRNTGWYGFSDEQINLINKLLSQTWKPILQEIHNAPEQNYQLIGYKPHNKITLHYPVTYP